MQRPAPARLVHQHERERQIDERWSAYGTRFAPIETGVSEENGDPTDKQTNEGHRRDPMGDADESRVPRRIEPIQFSYRELRDARGLRHEWCDVNGHGNGNTSAWRLQRIFLVGAENQVKPRPNHTWKMANGLT